MSVKIFTLSFSAQVQCHSSLNQMSINQKDSHLLFCSTNNQIQIHIYLHKSNELDHLLGELTSLGSREMNASSFSGPVQLQSVHSPTYFYSRPESPAVSGCGRQHRTSKCTHVAL
uniref:Uncharacterized protein n=1 Tax=Maylandia zebra TaxID=106582 RepID=A0A3P9BNR3_9CICH